MTRKSIDNVRDMKNSVKRQKYEEAAKLRDDEKELKNH